MDILLYYGFSGAIANFVVWISLFFPVFNILLLFISRIEMFSLSAILKTPRKAFKFSVQDWLILHFCTRLSPPARVLTNQIACFTVVIKGIPTGFPCRIA